MTEPLVRQHILAGAPKFFGLLGVFALLCAFPRLTIDWDGMAFLHKPDGALWNDPAHLLYPGTLKVLHWVGDRIGISKESMARGFSSLTATLALGLLVSLGGRLRAHSVITWLSALLLLATPSFFRQSVSVEVYAPALFGFLGAGVALLHYVERPTLLGLVPPTLFLALAIGFHVAALLSLPFLLSLTGALPRRLRWRHGFAYGALTCFAGLVAFSGIRDGVLEIWRQMVGYLAPRRLTADRALVLLGENFERGLGFLRDEAPVISVLSLSVTLLALSADRRKLVPGLWLFGTFFVAFLGLGVPMLGLLLPATAGLSVLLFLSDLALANAPKRQLLARGLLLGALVLQCVLSVPRVVADARTPDPLEIEALEIAQALPPRGIVVAGAHAQHLRYLTDVPVIALDEIFQAARSREGTTPDAIRVLRAALHPLTQRGHAAYLTNQGAARLVDLAAPAYGSREEALQDLRGRLFRGDEPIVVRTSAGRPLFLQRLRIR